MVLALYKSVCQEKIRILEIFIIHNLHYKRTIFKIILMKKPIMKNLFLVHGRNFKPHRNTLRELWIDTIKYRIKRDFNDEIVDLLNDITISFIYYGDLSNKF